MYWMTVFILFLATALFIASLYTVGRDTSNTGEHREMALPDAKGISSIDFYI